MTTELLMSSLADSERAVIVALIIVPLATFVISFLHGVYDGRFAPWRHVYASVVHVETLVLAAVGALAALMVSTGTPIGSLGLPTSLIVAFPLSWLFALLFVKRAVDFDRIRSVRSPIMLLLSWIVAWTAGVFAIPMTAQLLPDSDPLQAATVALPVFLILRGLLSLVARIRTR